MSAAAAAADGGGYDEGDPAGAGGVTDAIAAGLAAVAASSALAASKAAASSAAAKQKAQEARAKVKAEEAAWRASGNFPSFTADDKLVAAASKWTKKVKKGGPVLKGTLKVGDLVIHPEDTRFRNLIMSADDVEEEGFTTERRADALAARRMMYLEYWTAAKSMTKVPRAKPTTAERVYYLQTFAFVKAIQIKGVTSASTASARNEFYSIFRHDHSGIDEFEVRPCSPRGCCSAAHLVLHRLHWH